MPPKYTMGYLFIVIIVVVGSSACILTRNYSKWQADGEKIIDEKQVYRMITGIFAVGSFLDVIFMLLALIWLLFTLTRYVAAP